MNFDLGVVIAAITTVVFGVIGYLLSKKDFAQEKQIDDLYQKHEVDSKHLQDLSVKIAENYHAKSDIKDLMDTMKVFLNDRFNRLEDRLNEESDRRHSK